jgi:hypothetical protein
MGRSPDFSLFSIEQPQHVPSATILEQLKVDEQVQITFSEPYADHEQRIFRAVSVYYCEPSHLSKHNTYRVTDINYHPVFQQIGLRVITLIDVNHPNPSNHIDAWVITTDGFIRECEHFGLMYKIDSVTKK